jgi:hypothetical protein
MLRLTHLALLALMFFLNACTPSVGGTSVYSAFNLSDSKEITAYAGGSYYFYDIWGARRLGVDNLETIVEAAFDAPVGQHYPARVKGEFRASASDLPLGWKVKLQSAQGIQTLSKREIINNTLWIHWQETVKLLFALEVPSDAVPGKYKTTVLVNSSNGAKVDFPVTIIIPASSK